MNQYAVAVMSDTFETRKNTQASMITAGVAGGLLLLFILVRFSYPVDIPEVIPDTIEVNLGTSDMGSGKDQPQLPGEPAPSRQIAYVPPTPVKSIDESSKDVETSNRNDDVPEIKKPVVTKPNATQVDKEAKTVKTVVKPAPVVNVAPPRPKAVIGRTLGGNGNGGNGADSYKQGTNEGVAGGNGDQGRPNGVPGGKDYTGTPKNRGVQVVQIPNSSFEDEFNQNGKVAMDIVVDDNGKLISANYQPRGSTVSDRKMIDIARRRAGEIRFPHYDGGFRQTLIFEFKLKG
jgi:hypothetical protein